jgi:hypothetical protein
MCLPCLDHNVRNRGAVVTGWLEPVADDIVARYWKPSAPVALAPVEERAKLPVDPALTQNAESWLDHSRALVVENKSDFKSAATHLAGVKALIAKIEEWFAPHKKRLQNALDELRADERAMIDPLVAAEKSGKDTCNAWVRKEREREAQEKARRQREADAAEERRRLDAAAAMELEASRTNNVQLRDMAERLIEQPVRSAPMMPVESRVPKVSGVTMTTKWKARVTDKMALLKFVVAHPEYLHCVDENLPALNKLASSFKNTLAIDGVVAEDSMGMGINTSRVIGR